MLTFLIGLIIGGGLGALLMAFIAGAHKEEPHIREDGDVHHLCDDCKYYNIPSKNWPCRECHGDYYQSTSL